MNGYPRNEAYPVLKDMLMLVFTIAAACFAPVLMGIAVRIVWDLFMFGWRVLG